MNQLGQPCTICGKNAVYVDRLTGFAGRKADLNVYYGGGNDGNGLPIRHDSRHITED